MAAYPLSGNGTFLPFGSIGYCVGAVPVGTAPDERIGSEIAIRRFSIRGVLYFTNSGVPLESGQMTSFGAVRILIVHDRAFRGTMPVPSDILSDGNGDTYSDGLRFPNPDNTSRFAILFDEVYQEDRAPMAQLVHVTSAGAADPIISTNVPVAIGHSRHFNIDLHVHIKLTFDDSGTGGDAHCTSSGFFVLCYGISLVPSIESHEIVSHACCLYEEC